MKNIALIGMMGCGKTTCGRLLASRLHRLLVDTDAYIEAREGRTISEIFRDSGEAYFRDAETEALRALVARENLILAAGGGLPLRPENAALLKAGCVVFWLRRDPAEIFRSEDLQARPLAQNGKAAFLRLAAEREPRYRACADFIIENSAAAEDAVEEILRKLGEQP